MDFSQHTLAAWIVPDKTALCIIDVQDDFASPDGVMAGFQVDMTTLPAAIDNIASLQRAAITSGMPVIFVGLKTTADTDSATWKKWMTYRGFNPDESYAICRAGSGGDAFYGVYPQEQDLVVYKTKYSAFVETQLADKLHESGIENLIVCGLTTECCVDSTVRDAFHLDFSVLVVSDACAAYQDDFHRHTLSVLAENFSINHTTEEVVDALALVLTGETHVSA